MINISIHWYPGHMNKAKNRIYDLVKEVDLVVELRDARIPESSRNPVLTEIIKNKPIIVVLNKSDISDDRSNQKWIDWFNKHDRKAILASTKNNKQRHRLLNDIANYASTFVRKSKITGKPLRVPRILVVGIPNVGKSSFINFLAGRKSAGVGAKPGHTRGKQLISVASKLQIVDTPGVLWPKFEDKDVALKLAATGAIKENNFPIDEVLEFILSIIAPDISWIDYVEDYAKNRGFLMQGSALDLERAKTVIYNNFASGSHGKYTLELPNEQE